MEGEGSRPNRLHRRDTPHHLKNKRINSQTIDQDKVASIIAQVSCFCFHIHPRLHNVSHLRSKLILKECSLCLFCHRMKLSFFYLNFPYFSPLLPWYQSTSTSCNVFNSLMCVKKKIILKGVWLLTLLAEGIFVISWHYLS